MPARPITDACCAPPDGTVPWALEAYERGQTLEALRRAEAFAPIRLWAGADACVLAARIARSAGAPRLALRLALRARASGPDNPRALLEHGQEILNRRGPLALRRLLGRERDRAEAAPPRDRAELLALEAEAAGLLRDFRTAEDLLAQAEALSPETPWIRIQRAHHLELLDRVEEALETARSALRLHPHPFYRPAVQFCAHFLQVLDRDEEAIRLLAEANAALESGPVSAQLYSLLAENDRWAEAEATLERYVALSPLLELPLRQWVAAQRAHAAYRLGRRADAARFASEVDDDFHRNFARRLAEPPPERESIRLDVSFVRQHFKTCAPATLAAIGRFWRMPAEHLQLVEALCYDGTPRWQQRRWGEENGWHVREFRVTRESAVALIEKGIPFAISASGTQGSHMMAVIGFDRTRNALLLRDPGEPYVVEAEADEFLKRHRAFGPQGAVFVPLAERSKLDGVELPDAEAYDEYHRLWIALARHDRAGAGEALGRMEAAFPETELLWQARLDVAAYDANVPEETRCLRKLLELFPGEPVRTLQLCGCLSDAPREERIELLRPACAADRPDPALLVELARELGSDARSLPEAHRRLRRSLRFRPLNSHAIGVQAQLFEAEGNLEEAAALRRFAANLEEYRESLYRAWFFACRRVRKTDEALAHLTDRFARFGRRSAEPGLTLAWAWRELERPDRVREVLAEAARLRPDDGDLLLGSANLLATLGDHGEAERLLGEAKGKVRENDWLRATAEIAETRLDTPAALSRFGELLAIEPLALDAHARVVEALARLEGPAAALAHLRGACAQFPSHHGLRRMLVEWTRPGDPAALEEAARALLRLAPSDAWAHRELALALSKAERHEEALREAKEAAAIEPRNTFSFSVLGQVCWRLGRHDEAREGFRRAVACSADNRVALCSLLDLARTDEERRAELAFVESELVRQVVGGDGVLAYLELARPALDPSELLRSLRRIHRERPDLPQAWSALISQLGHLGFLDEALCVARDAAGRFPHLPGAWLDLASVHRWRGEAAAETETAGRAFEMDPAHGAAALALAEAHERRGELEDALRVYDRALQHLPRDPDLHASRARVLWLLGKRDEALRAVETALRLAPDYGWAWGLLGAWAEDRGELRRPADFARALARERPGEARVWIVLARTLSDPSDLPERLEAIERALRLDPRSAEPWDLKAQSLAEAERFDEAVRACEEGAAACAADAVILQGRRAWIEACRRRLPEAIRQMRAVLAENAGYAWGWTRLAEWLAEDGRADEAEAAFERVVRLLPHESRVRARLGELRLKRGDRRGAREEFSEALRLDPSNDRAARCLFDLQLEGGDVRGAGETLSTMRTHQPWAATVAAEIRFRRPRAEDAAEAEAD
ncbi:MAG: tetratricopeptide repeat protein, partial [Planctomycetota bacterium]